MASISLLEIFLAVISFVVLRYLLNTKGMPINWPVVGMLPDTIFNFHRIHERFAEVLEQNGLTFLYAGPWFSNVKILGTVDPANIHYVMSSNFANFPKGSEFSKIFNILGDGIFNSDSDSWKNQRKTAQALINHQRFHQFLVKTCRNMVEKGLLPVLEHVADQESVMDLQDIFQRFTFDITCILVTGYNPKCLSIAFPEVEFSKAIDDAEEALFYRHFCPEYTWKLQRWLGFGQEWKMEKAWKVLDDVSARFVSRKREQLKEGSILREDGEGVDLLTSYMSSEVESNGPQPEDKFLRDTIINFLLAGRDTTSSALTWLFWLVCKNPQVLSKIREEIKAKIPENQDEKCRMFNPQELNSLVYLHGAFCESLRLYPPVPFQHKAPLREDVLPSGHKVSPDMKIIFCLYSMGRMASIWGEDCLEFKPERWITGGKIKHEPSYKFLAFNAGPRTCLGKEIAFIQMKTVAAFVLNNYNVHLVEGQHVSPATNSIILHMKYGLKVSVSRRWV
ncbi:alkane hydroxylase MAH1 [Ricinus communis]|uniref:Cytochrome P450, putative n=1 Tax=Ricinus communis TaxID=3988 RepID=B9STA8_RICCO|nr:alkane hydroxylase MAH1 [Ricinus communis]EEF33140.1 cytochrome P450, putative [Ricinus communis]|eukprot:XP_002529227.1 alkane hydroxylase MAH1 [Ricinus communis]